MVAVTLTSARALLLRLLFPLAVLAPAALAPGCAPARIRADDGPLVDGLPGTVYAAHRGGAREVPENSMSGLLATYREHTTDVLDVDVRSLRGGTLVAMHDRTLDRTTDHSGPVGDLSLRDWRRVRIRPSPHLPGDWRRERPPTAAEVLDRFGGRTVLNIEIKDAEGLRPLARLVRERDLTGSVYVQSNSVRLAARAHRMGLLTSVWRSVEQARTDRPSRWRRYVDMLSVDHRARGSDIRRAARSGIARVWAHTVLTPAARDRVLRLGCDGVMTDAPRLLARTDSGEGPRTANMPARPGS
jgi:glycerophosphoryl diester phosphodiesterase